jgi:hypothetical protein
VWACCRSLAVIAGFNPAGGIVNVVCYQIEVSAKGRTLVQRSSIECVCFVSLSVIRCNSNPLHLQWQGRRRQAKREETKKQRKERKNEWKKKERKWVDLVELATGLIFIEKKKFYVMCEVSLRRIRKMVAIRTVCSSCLSLPMVKLGCYWTLIEKLYVGNILLSSADSIKFSSKSDKSKPLYMKTCLHLWYLATYDVTSQLTVVKNFVYIFVYGWQYCHSAIMTATCSVALAGT